MKARNPLRNRELGDGTDKWKRNHMRDKWFRFEIHEEKWNRNHKSLRYLVHTRVDLCYLVGILSRLIQRFRFVPTRFGPDPMKPTLTIKV